MIGHITIGAKDKAKSAAFYEAALGPLGYAKAMDNERWTGFSGGEGTPFVLVGHPHEGEATFGNGSMLGFHTDSRAKVKAAYEAGIAAGGKDEGAPGPRPAGPPNTYAAYLRDPTGNKLGFFTTVPE
jgi:catechol 2,3-dioxygenase-like lactoylglutathione lyase family enzyme